MAKEINLNSWHSGFERIKAPLTFQRPKFDFLLLIIIFLDKAYF